MLTWVPEFFSTTIFNHGEVCVNLLNGFKLCVLNGRTATHHYTFTSVSLKRVAFVHQSLNIAAPFKYITHPICWIRGQGACLYHPWLRLLVFGILYGLEEKDWKNSDITDDSVCCRTIARFPAIPYTLSNLVEWATFICVEAKQKQVQQVKLFHKDSVRYSVGLDLINTTVSQGARESHK